MRETRIRQLEQTNREQRDEIDRLKEVNARLERQALESKISCYNEFAKIMNIGHSNDINKVIKITDISDKMVNDLFGDIKIDLYAENDEKILELPITRKSIR